MVTDKERDARRVLEEARSLLEHKPEAYVARPRLLGDEDPLEPEPEPEELEPPRRLDTEPRSAPADPWANWERWVSVRIAAALEVERERTAEVVALALGETVADERQAAAQTWRDQVRGLRADLARTEAVLEQLRRLVEIERHKVLDLPALPLSRRDIN